MTDSREDWVEEPLKVALVAGDPLSAAEEIRLLLQGPFQIHQGIRFRNTMDPRNSAQVAELVLWNIHLVSDYGYIYLVLPDELLPRPVMVGPTPVVHMLPRSWLSGPPEVSDAD